MEEMTREKAQEMLRKAENLLESGMDGCRARKVGGGTYDSSAGTLTVKFEFTLDGAKGRERVDFERYAYQYGLRPDDFGKHFQHEGHTWSVVGLKVKARKYTIRAMCLDKGHQKIRVFTEDFIRQKLRDQEHRASA